MPRPKRHKNPICDVCGNTKTQMHRRGTDGQFHGSWECKPCAFELNESGKSLPHDIGEDKYTPKHRPKPTDTPPGSLSRLLLYRRRVEAGEPLWCEGDREDHDGANELPMRRGSHIRPLLDDYERPTIHIDTEINHGTGFGAEDE